MPSSVDQYWNQHTVLDGVEPKSAKESLDLLHFRNHEEYPFCAALMGYYQNHTGKILLDYGCGPGNDVLGYLLEGSAKKIIGIDVSQTALRQLQNRLKLHGQSVDLNKLELILTTNKSQEIPLENNIIDYINCAGVLQHTENPQQILAEFYRVLKPAGMARVMIYNHSSLWLHLFVAYVIRILNKSKFRDHVFAKNQSPEEIFSQTTDGIDCPLSRAWKPANFIALCQNSGLTATFLGGYFAPKELNTWINSPDHVLSWQKLIEMAINCPQLEDRHKNFLRNVSSNPEGFPLYEGLYCGVFAVYELVKR